MIDKIKMLMYNYHMENASGKGFQGKDCKDEKNKRQFRCKMFEDLHIRRGNGPCDGGCSHAFVSDRRCVGQAMECISVNTQTVASGLCALLSPGSPEEPDREVDYQKRSEKMVKTRIRHIDLWADPRRDHCSDHPDRSDDVQESECDQSGRDQRFHFFPVG